jgi:hypothetical protein
MTVASRFDFSRHVEKVILWVSQALILTFVIFIKFKVIENEVVEKALLFVV